MLQRPRNGTHNAHQHYNDGEDDSALRMIAEGVEHFGAGEDMEADEEDIVGKQHESSKLVCDLAVPTGIVCEVADVLDLRIPHDELMHRH